MPEKKREIFFEYYEKYIVAKERVHSLSVWLNAVYCRQRLQELATTPHTGPKPEEEIMQNLFGGVLTKQKITEMYNEILNDSRKTPYGSV